MSGPSASTAPSSTGGSCSTLRSKRCGAWSGTPIPEGILPLGGALIPYVVDPLDLQRELGVPVFNTKSTSIRFAETCHALGLTHSQITYPTADLSYADFTSRAFEAWGRLESIKATGVSRTHVLCSLGWRCILAFATDFPGAEIVRLDQSYRSTTPVLELANAVMASAAEAYPKRLWSAKSGGDLPTLFTCLDEPQQADLVCRQVLEQRVR